MTMSSYLTNSHFYSYDPVYSAPSHDNTCLQSQYESLLPSNEYPHIDQASIITHALALLQPRNENSISKHSSRSNIGVEITTPSRSPHSYERHDSAASALETTEPYWQQMYQTSMSNPVVTTRRPFKRVRTHERTPSASTIASNGPASPYTAHTSFPHIVNTDYAPNSPAHYADQAAFFSKPLPTPQQTPTDTSFTAAGYIPTPLAHPSNVRWTMNGAPLQNFADEFPPEFYQSSRQSMSSGHDSPATPQSVAGEHYDSKPSLPVNHSDFRQAQPSVQLFRTDSQAYQDELYNPSTFAAAPAQPPKRATDYYLSPHRNLVTERLQTANLARSTSPGSAVSRERSPFRDGAPLAPAYDWKTTGQVKTAAGLRQQQKEEAAQAEYAQHVPQLQRERTKTISPKDAVLEYHDTDQAPLFHDQVPVGYKQHHGVPGGWQNTFASQPGSSFGALTATNSAQQQMPFRATPNDSNWSDPNANFMYMPPTSNQDTSQIQTAQFHNNSYAQPKMNFADSTPEFPAHLTRMESSVDESGPPFSSQNSFQSVPAIQRPADTRANTGAYSCTYHGCTQRFDSHINLQQHKRDHHRAQQVKEATSTPSGTESVSPRSTESPAPSGSGMTSAAILARNSQAGPHKCTRINPSTNKPCNTVFSRPYDLTRHEDTIHNGRKQKVRCPMCREEKTFSRNDALTRHMRVVHPEVESFGKRSRRDE